MRFLVMLCTALLASVAIADDQLIRIETRPGVTVPVYLMKREHAKAVAVLLPGGAGGFGQLVDGKPSGANFLVRSRDYFADAGLTVAVVGRASDKQDLDYATRVGAEHVEDLRKVVEQLQADAALPLWLIGTSRGTVSATAAAIAFGNEKLAGLVLTSSVVNFKKTGAVPTQNLAAIRIPVLVLHHEKDACAVCRPHEVSFILKGLVSAPVKKLMMVGGGGDPAGDPCEALHYHGFIGMEKEAVALITDWIRTPSP